MAVAGDYAYVTNTRSNNLTAYSIDADGTLTHPWDATTGMRPLDAAVSNDEGYLYVLNAGDHSFSIYEVDSATGLLTEQAAFTGLPETAAGVVAR